MEHSAPGSSPAAGRHVPAHAGNTLVLVADATRARLFEAPQGSQQLTELDDLVNPDGHAHERDLAADAPGRQAKGRVGSGHSLYGGATMKRHHTEDFAGMLCHRLESAQRRSGAQRLYIAAPPEFLGLLRQRMDHGLRACVAGEIAKSLTTRTPQAIRAELPPRL